MNGIADHLLVRCRVCRRWVYPPYGKDEPAVHAGATGQKHDPRAPGDRDDICDVCDYTRLPERQPR